MREEGRKETNEGIKKKTEEGRKKQMREQRMEARKEGRSQLAPARFWLETPNYGRCSVLGSAMFQTLFKFNADSIPMFSESLVSMTDVEVFKVCQDSAGSRAIDSYGFTF